MARDALARPVEISGRAQRGDRSSCECQQFLRDRSAARHLAASLNDRDVPNTAPSPFAVVRRQPLHSGHGLCSAEPGW